MRNIVHSQEYSKVTSNTNHFREKTLMSLSKMMRYLTLIYDQLLDYLEAFLMQFWAAHGKVFRISNDFSFNYHPEPLT